MVDLTVRVNNNEWVYEKQMRILFIILTFSFLTAFQDGQGKTILNFANEQTDFETLPTFKTGYFVNSIENHELHNQKFEIAIKANNSHSNKKQLREDSLCQNSNVPV